MPKESLERMEDVPQKPAETVPDMPPVLPEETVILQVQPVGPVRVDAIDTGAPTLDTAFMTLCQALGAALDDDIPGQAHAEEIQGWAQNGNTVVAWRHAIMLLERVLGEKLGG